MKLGPNFEIVENTEKHILLRDLGPWDQHPTITNAAELVVAQFAEQLGNRRLEYFDSDNRRDQLLVEEGKFAGFKPIGGKS